MRKVSLLGASGSVGASTLDVIARHPDRFEVHALAASRRWKVLLEQCRRFRPALAALLDEEAARLLARAIAAEGLPTEVLGGEEGVVEVARASQADTVLAAIAGAAGLAPTLAAARAGKRILLANKEALVMGGVLFLREVAAGGATLLPIDSEHNAIAQCLPPDYARDPERRGVRRLILTASGGPFRDRPLAELDRVSPEEACAHPNWLMGRKISVDSATMMNKGLEVIEARLLFGVDPGAIEVVIHRESVVHSLVEYVDGSVLAQLGHPDMRTPIAQALAYPDRVDAGIGRLDLAQLASLSFARPDLARFPCLQLAFDALSAGGSAPLVLNAVNEVAVAAFLEGRARFTDIARACRAVLERADVREAGSLAEALALDAEVRERARALLADGPGLRTPGAGMMQASARLS